VDSVIRPLGRPGDLGWVVQQHGELYATEYGWDTDVLVAGVVAAYAGTHDPAREAAWIAEVGDQRVGCVFCVAADEQTAQLRLLLLTPAARGHGLGTRLVDTCLAFARDAGYQRMLLWTHEPLATARRIYLAAGFRRTGTDPHDHFGVPIDGQIYTLDLHQAAPAS
jgi:GNAT superfamily N-acetyltransferase